MALPSQLKPACGMGAGTVSEYLARAAQAGLTWPLPAELDDVALEALLFPAVPPGQERARPDLLKVHQELKRPGVTLHLLWQEYREVHPDGYGYSRFCEIYRSWERKLKRSMRQQHRAGERTFVDFSGKKPHIVDPNTGEEIAVELFVGALGASSYTYAEATHTQQLHEWIGAHTRILEYFGGSTEIWAPDQLKSAVTRSCRYEPGINQSYQELATHCGAVVIPARLRKPRDKAKVESMVLVVQRWIVARLRNRTFFSLGERNAAIGELLEQLNDRPMQKIGKSRRELWEQIDRPALKPLPVGRYDLPEWHPCKPNIDYLRRGREALLQRPVPAQRAADGGALHLLDRRGLLQGQTDRVPPAPLRSPAVDGGRPHAQLAPGSCGVDAVAPDPLGGEGRPGHGPRRRRDPREPPAS